MKHFLNVHCEFSFSYIHVHETRKSTSKSRNIEKLQHSIISALKVQLFKIDLHLTLAEYDQDADGVLSAEEQRAMNACLEGQKDELAREIAEAKNEDDEDRPKSRARSSK